VGSHGSASSHNRAGSNVTKKTGTGSSSHGNIGRIPQLRSLSVPKTQSFQGMSGGRIGHGMGRR
jgi:hypothetical protein